MPFAASAADLPLFEAEYAPDDRALIAAMLDRAAVAPQRRDAIRERARAYVEAIRSAPKGAGLEDFMQEYSLSTKEGLALMVLAEALLRVPDAETQDELIEDKLGGGAWDGPDGDEGWLLMAASWGIGLGARIVRPGETPGRVLGGLVKRLGVPVVRTGARQAMQYLGYNFVLGQTIEGALDRARKGEAKGLRYSYDMLGEGARTFADAERYHRSYADAIEAIGARAQGALPDRPGISVKLSALHPRYHLRAKGAVMADLVPKLGALAKAARAHDLNFTVDAEEADRLELSLDVFAAVAADPDLGGWDGFGLAVQAYQKRAPQVIDHVIALAEWLDRRFMVRLVKGAYWDTEIKRAQERGLSGFPVWTRKAATDLCYLDCARRMLAARDRLYPQFATHNAVTLATIMELGGREGYEFQRLHGMGETLYGAAEMRETGAPVRIYAPVGGYRDLLAYLVRRLLENAANSSFVAQVADERVGDDALLAFPGEQLERLMARDAPLTHPRIAAPLDMLPGRRNSRGVEFGYKPDLRAVASAVRRWEGPGVPVTAVIGGSEAGRSGDARTSVNPATGEALGEWIVSDGAAVAAACEGAAAAFPAWNEAGPHRRAGLLRRYADVLETHQGRLIGALVREAGKTMDDAVAELREAADFARYYAGEAERVMPPRALPGPVGEANTYALEGRGVIACVAPWNFPLAIFLGQALAAMAAGCTVVAKPAPQTPITASLALGLMAEAGIPPGVCNMVLGEGAVGAALIANARVAGAAFTGSTGTARAINRALAQRDGPILPLIAETGGVNAMIVDSTALPEQVADDVIQSAFRSAGQRCSALRVLYLQEDVADRMLEMIVGAGRALVLGDPSDPDTDVGPVIDGDARERLRAHWADMKDLGREVWRGEAPDTPELADGTFFAPRIVELDAYDAPTDEAFGPILHVVRWHADDLDEVLSAIHATGYGLTFGVHSRLDGRIEDLVRRSPAGNTYVNRNTVGAVVGVQPFGGRGLSGTGPKAGGPLYLTRFCEERTVTINTAAAGGNASLIALPED